MVSILLEELKAVYPKFEYEVIPIDFSKNEQKEESVLAFINILMQKILTSLMCLSGGS